MRDVYLSDFQIVKPKNKIAQDDLLQWTIACHQTAEKNRTTAQSAFDSETDQRIAKLFARYSVKDTQISSRYFECDDILSTDLTKAEIYNVSNNSSTSAHVSSTGIDISGRAQFFSGRALEVFKKFYSGAQAPAAHLLDNVPTRLPDHLIHVTCTGYISPSAAQRIVTEEFWTKQTEITHAYHMGCYAAMPAVRLARSLVAAGDNFQTDIVHTEMCGLHMNPLAHTPEQMVVQTLFADGHIKYSAKSRQDQNVRALRILAIQELVVPDSTMDMSWVPAPWGMQMNLSRDVPMKIKASLRKFAEQLFLKAGLPLAEVKQAVFAIHPGGPKIIDAVQEVLELNEDKIRESRNVLLNRGNMSSATLPHVWQEIIDNNYPVGTKIVSFAFGPGLTLFGSVFELA